MIVKIIVDLSLTILVSGFACCCDGGDEFNSRRPPLQVGTFRNKNVTFGQKSQVFKAKKEIQNNGAKYVNVGLYYEG